VRAYLFGAEVALEIQRSHGQKHTTGGIPRWSPTLVLVARFSAYVWQSGRDAQFSLTYGRMCYSANVRRIYYVDSNALGCLQQVDLPGPEVQRQCSLQIFGTIEMTPPPTFLADTVSALLEVVV
jgi:hypothetical protein